MPSQTTDRSPSPPPDSPPLPNSDIEHDEEPTPAPFSGDFYGTDYHPDKAEHAEDLDIEQPDNGAEDGGPIFDIAEDADPVFDDNDRVERVEIHRSNPAPEGTPDEDEEVEEAAARPHTGQPAWADTVIVPYPGEAGAAVGHADEGGYDAYGAAVTQDPNNPWHPFPDKLS
ncbi:hypothetical protein FA95DRAFT_1612540 [Auriscalpium vulgare]|uniref:Uncharacterized protein n=1 Tax=Auriscalpium vulgare TaxID=40419 RepID=A0ACB8R6D1_9AGAM|nr:hypothetical protein FA95DRAFT_1612540 [Auriscalpium vulgare]